MTIAFATCFYFLQTVISDNNINIVNFNILTIFQIYWLFNVKNVLSACMYEDSMHAGLLKSRRGCQIPWNWNYRQLWAAMRVQGIKPSSSGRTASAPYCRATLYCFETPLLILVIVLLLWQNAMIKRNLKKKYYWGYSFRGFEFIVAQQRYGNMNCYLIHNEGPERTTQTLGMVWVVRKLKSCP